MYLGIDLGTSNSAIVGSSDGATRLFKTAQGTDVLPSIIYLDKRGHRFIGVGAYDRTFTSPENVAAGFKRLMGTSSTVNFKAAGLEWSPEECSAEILRTLVGQAKVEAGDVPIDGAVITVPAAFNQMQSEATLRAAHMAGLKRVALLQEPVAASMASIANSATPNGQFLVFDLGGGTFDVALVSSINGAVNVMAHEGINMLGGRDFDRLIIDACVRPWLHETFTLPKDFQRQASFQRLMGIARHAVERARIDLSTSETATVHASDEEVRATDAKGDEIYLSVDITRRDVEVLVAERVDESIALCRKMLRDNGFSYEDISRVVLIGGPTKMPMIRERVPQELGIAMEPGLDPMTAVATGAAIFAESREWTDTGAKRRSGRKTEKTSGDVEVTYRYPETVTDENAQVLLKAASGAPKGLFVEIKDRDGVSTGRVALEGSIAIPLRVREKGTNAFEARVTDGAGRVVESACRQFTIFRGQAAVSADQARQTIAVKVQAGQVGSEHNELERLVRKGDPLPAEGVTTVRAAKDLRGGEPGFIAIELYEQTEDLQDPALNLMVGDFRIDAVRDLDRSNRIKRGDELHLHWKMNESGLLSCSVEIVGRILDSRELYIPQDGHVTYGGADGAAIASELLADAERDLDQAEEVLGRAAAEEVSQLKRRIERQHLALSSGVDAEIHRGAAEEARRIRQDIAFLKLRPEHRERVLVVELDEVERRFDEFRDTATSVALDRFDRLLSTAHRAMREQNFDGVERAIRELEAIHRSVLFADPEFQVALAVHLGEQRHLSADQRLHDQLVLETKVAIQNRDTESIRAIIGRHFENRIATGGSAKDIPKLADLLRR